MADTHDGIPSIATLPVPTIRNALLGTMVLGLPQVVADRPTCYFEREVDWSLHDREDKPWDWEQAPTAISYKEPVQPVVAYEFFAPLGRQGAYFTEAGEFNPTTLVLTLFEAQFEQVKGFSYVTVGPSATAWYFRYWRPAGGLDTLQVYEVVCTAQGLD